MTGHRRARPPSGPSGPLRWVTHRVLASGLVPSLPELRERFAPPSGPAVAHRLEVFAVEDTAVQVSWGALGPGPVRLHAQDSTVDVVADGRPGAVVIAPLRPDAPVHIDLRGEGVPGRHLSLTARTLAPPPGEELYRFATLSDVHAGATTFGYLHTIADPDVLDPHPLRCTRAALREAVAWGAEQVVVKGDLVDQGHPAAWDAVSEVLASSTVPVHLLPGNHETKHRRTIEPEVAAAAHGLRVVRGLSAQDVPGLRLLLVDTARVDDDRGRLDHVVDELCRLAWRSGTGVVVAMHHHVQRSPVPAGWPLGIPRAEAMRALDRIAAANPATLLTSGHVHRNRRWQHGPLVLTTVGSVKDYPGAWAGYVVHEGGIRQVVRRVAAPDAIRWTERTGDAMLGGYRHWTPGRLDARCFSWTWPGRRA